MKMSEIFEEAAKRIGVAWAQGIGTFGGYDNENGGFCAVLTLRNVCSAGDDDRMFPAWSLLGKCVGAKQIENVFDWNDAPERTQAEVAAMFRAIAATERAREGRLLPVVIAETVPA